MTKQKNLGDWRVAAFSVGGKRSVPSHPGVYAILRVERILGLPHQVEVLYIGRSGNLRIRLGRHLSPMVAHNEVSFLPDRSTLEFWCHFMPGEDIASAEKTLIRSLKPTTNKVRYFSNQ